MKRLFFFSLFIVLSIGCAAQNPQPMPYNLTVPTAGMKPGATQVWAVDAGNTFAKINISDLGLDGSEATTQTLTFSGDDLGLSNSNSIDLSKYSQTLSISGDQLSISGVPGSVTIPVGSGGGGGTATTDASQLSSGTLPDARLSGNVIRADRTTEQNMAGDLDVNGTLYSDRYMLGSDFGIHPLPNKPVNLQAYHGIRIDAQTKSSPQGYIPVNANSGLGKDAYHVNIPMNLRSAAGLSILGASSQTANYLEITSYANRNSSTNRGDVFRINKDGNVYIKNQLLDPNASGGTGGSSGGGSYSPPAIITTSADRNLATNDIGNTIECTANATITIPADFSQMAVGQTVNIEAHNGAELIIVGAPGVTINYGNSTPARLSSRTQMVLFGVIRKQSANNYIISGQ